MLYLTCTMISSVDLAYYGASHAKGWVILAGGTNMVVIHFKQSINSN